MMNKRFFKITVEVKVDDDWTEKEVWDELDFLVNEATDRPLIELLRGKATGTWEQGAGR